MTPPTLKPGWKTYRFDQIAISVTDRVQPADTELEHYIGLEHLDPESLKIRRWGVPSDVKGQKLGFRKGDIIFGKRRAYQRKLAIADFDGICSAHAMVLRPKTDVVLPEFLPFFMQSDLFMIRALEISVGSLSPTINWRTLAQQEFPLPPLDEQHRIAEVLLVARDNHEALYSAIESSERLFQSTLFHLMSVGVTNEETTKTGNISHPISWSVKELGEIAKVERGKFSHRPRNLPQFYDGPYPFVQTGDVGASRGALSQVSQTLSEEGVQYSRSFPKNTILITIAAVIGATAITDDEIWCTDSVVGIIPKDDIDVYYLEYALRNIRPYLEFQAATQTAQKNINLGILKPLKIPIPNYQEQKSIVEILRRTENSITPLEKRLVKNHEIMKNLINEHLWGGV